MVLFFKDFIVFSIKRSQFFIGYTSQPKWFAFEHLNFLEDRQGSSDTSPVQVCK